MGGEGLLFTFGEGEGDGESGRGWVEVDHIEEVGGANVNNRSWDSEDPPFSLIAIKQKFLHPTVVDRGTVRIYPTFSWDGRQTRTVGRQKLLHPAAFASTSSLTVRISFLATFSVKVEEHDRMVRSEISPS